MYVLNITRDTTIPVCKWSSDYSSRAKLTLIDMHAVPGSRSTRLVEKPGCTEGFTSRKLSTNIVGAANITIKGNHSTSIVVFLWVYVLPA